jgi:hypothetical protein
MKHPNAIPVPTDEEWLWERRGGAKPQSDLLIEKRMREDLPYGVWVCADGMEVLFNRWYRPIWQRAPGQVATLADGDERVDWGDERWFYDDAGVPWWSPKVRAALDRVLTDFREGRRIER